MEQNVTLELTREEAQDLKHLLFWALDENPDTAAETLCHWERALEKLEEVLL